MSKRELKKLVAANIKAKREAIGMKQTELAKRAKLTPRYISILEKGSKNLTLETLEDICYALRISVCELICPSDSGGRRSALLKAKELIDNELKFIP